jgi:hypothetical protein
MKKILFLFFLVINLSFSSPIYTLKAKDVDDRLDIYINGTLVYSFNRSGWLPEQSDTQINLTNYLISGKNCIRFVVFEFGKYRWNADLKLYENDRIIWQDHKSEGVKDGDSGVKYDESVILNLTRL